MGEAMSGRSNRFALAAALGAVLFAAPALAAGGKSVEVAKAFPYLENYLTLPAAQRTHFTVAYILSENGRPATSLKAWVVDGGQRIPIVINANGKIMRSPTLGQLRSHAMVQFDAPPTTKFSERLSIEPLIPASASLDASYLVIAVNQADAAVRKAAGVLGFAAPKLTRIVFTGGAGGEAVWPDGHAVKLGVQKGMMVFDINAQKGAKTIRFTRAPTSMEVG
jgi:hypothetical protein